MTTRMPGLRPYSTGALNPKDLVGASKVDLSLVPPIAIYHEALAMTDGDIKYGPYNWRSTPILTRSYIAAVKRHLDLFLEGEDYDPKSQAHHLGHARAGCGIVLDALHFGHLVDDRAFENPGYAQAVARLDEINKQKRELYAEQQRLEASLKDRNTNV